MRQLTINEVLEVADKVRHYLNVVEYRQYALDIYGPSAVKLHLETQGEYNDEGGMDYRITDATAYDIAGNELSPDLSTEWWKAHIKDPNEDFSNVEEWEDGDFDSCCGWEYYDYRAGLPHPNDYASFDINLVNMPEEFTVFIAD